MYLCAMQTATNSGFGTIIGLLTTRSSRGVCEASAPPSPTSNQDHGALCIVEAMERVLEEHGVEHNSKMFSPYFVGLQSQLEGKWKYAANAYRTAHPNDLPAEKYYRNRCYKRLLPRTVAEERMVVWIPWAIQRLQPGFAELAQQFAALTLDRQAAVDAEPEEDVLEDEVV
jgi:hypothetical protein